MKRGLSIESGQKIFLFFLYPFSREVVLGVCFCGRSQISPTGAGGILSVGVETQQNTRGCLFKGSPLGRDGGGSRLRESFNESYLMMFVTQKDSFRHAFACHLPQEGGFK